MGLVMDPAKDEAIPRFTDEIINEIPWFGS